MARINIEESAWRRIVKLAGLVGCSDREALGACACLWGESQDILRTHGTREEILDWAHLFNLSPELQDRWLDALERARIISRAENSDEQLQHSSSIAEAMVKHPTVDAEAVFEIRGNANQIENMVAKINATAKGGQRTKERWAELKKKAQKGADSGLEHSSSIAEAMLEPSGSIAEAKPKPSISRRNSMQGNASQYNGKNSAEAFDAVFKYNLAELFDLYPRHEKKTESLEILAQSVSSDDDRAAWERAIRAYAARCRNEEREQRHILTFPKFAKEWREWADLKLKPVLPPDIVER